MELTSQAIAEYATAFSYTDLSEAAVDAAERLTLDSIGCCLGAFPSPPSKRLRGLYGDIGGAADETATVIGSGRTTRLEYAGLINATLVRYLDYNDTYISQGRACHPSDHIPALLSAAETMERTGRELIEAIVLAYEVEGLGLDTGVLWGGGYDYVTWGAYSSVAAVGKLMGLTRDQLVHALGIAGASNLTLGVSRRGEVSMWKGIAHPYVTHNAIQACQLARAGVTGPAQVVEGPGGLTEVTGGDPLTVSRLGGRDGAGYRITDANIKPYPCGYYLQPMIAGVLDLVDAHDLQPADVDTVRVETFQEAADILATPEKWSRELTRESADHSIPYTMAIALRYGDVTPEHFGERYREAPAVHDLMDRIVVEEDATLNQFAAEHPRSTPTVVRLIVDDEAYSTRIDYAPGHAENPLSREALRSKLVEQAEPLLTEEQCTTLISECETLRGLSRIDSLIDATTV